MLFAIRFLEVKTYKIEKTCGIFAFLRFISRRKSTGGNSDETVFCIEKKKTSMSTSNNYSCKK